MLNKSYIYDVCNFCENVGIYWLNYNTGKSMCACKKHKPNYKDGWHIYTK